MFTAYPYGDGPMVLAENPSLTWFNIQLLAAMDKAQAHPNSCTAGAPSHAFHECACLPVILLLAP